jgi:hypothetical protein
MNTGLLSKLLTFLSGCTMTIAGYGVAGTESGIPKWLILTCIVLTGGFAKASIGALPVKTNGAAIAEGAQPVVPRP